MFQEWVHALGDGDHYRNQQLCRVPGTHGKAPKTHGKRFAVCRTRQRARGKQPSAKSPFAVCNISGTRQRLCRVPWLTHSKHFWLAAKLTWRGTFVVCHLCLGHGKGSIFAMCLGHCTRQRLVPLPCAIVFAHGKGSRFNFFVC